jgi:hypothetical protein
MDRKDRLEGLLSQEESSSNVSDPDHGRRTATLERELEREDPGELSAFKEDQQRRKAKGNPMRYLGTMRHLK